MAGLGLMCFDEVQVKASHDRDTVQTDGERTRTVLNRRKRCTYRILLWSEEREKGRKMREQNCI